MHKTVPVRVPIAPRAVFTYGFARLIRIGWSYLKCRRYGSGKFHFGIYKNIPKIYSNISKYIQDIQRYTKIYKIPSGGRAAPPGPAPAPRARIYLDIFGYLFGIFLYIPKWNFPEKCGSIFQLIGHSHILGDFFKKPG